MTPTKKPIVKEEEVRRESEGDHSSPPAAAAVSPEKSSPKSQKRKSSTVVTEAGSCSAAKIPKLEIEDRKKKFVPTALYKVSRSYQDTSGKKFSVIQGERVKFIRYCEEVTEGSNYVEVVNQFQKRDVIPEGILDNNLVSRFCPCRNVHFFKENAYLNHQVVEHYYWPLYNPTFPNLNSLMLHYGGLPHARVLVLVQQLKLSRRC